MKKLFIFSIMIVLSCCSGGKQLNGDMETLQGTPRLAIEKIQQDWDNQIIYDGDTLVIGIDTVETIAYWSAREKMDTSEVIMLIYDPRSDEVQFQAGIMIEQRYDYSDGEIPSFFSISDIHEFQNKEGQVIRQEFIIEYSPFEYSKLKITPNRSKRQ